MWCFPSSEIGKNAQDVSLGLKRTVSSKRGSAWMTTTHEKLLNMIKTSIDQLANDQTVPRKQLMRELIDIREYIQSAVEIIRYEAIGEKKI